MLASVFNMNGDRIKLTPNHINYLEIFIEVRKWYCLFSGMLFYGIGSNPNEFASLCDIDYADC